MRLFAVADLHGDFSAFEEVRCGDVVIVAGDVALRGEPFEDLKDAANGLRKVCSRAQVLFASGNHDTFLKRDASGRHCIEKIKLASLMAGVDGFRALDGLNPSCLVGTIKVSGFEWQQSRGRAYRRIFEENPDAYAGTDILVMHCPPKVDRGRLRDESGTLRRIVMAINPKMVICGHEHHPCGDGRFTIGDIPVFCLPQKILHEVKIVSNKFHVERVAING